MSGNSTLQYNTSSDVVHYTARPDDFSILQQNDATSDGDRRRNNVNSDDKLQLGGISSNEVVLNSATAPVPKLVPTAAPMTVCDAVEHIGMGRFQLIIIVICGLFTFADAMEMLLLAVLAPILKCEWLLEEYHVAFITTIVFIGYMLMAPVWGALADHYGRKNILVGVCLWIAFYGFLTAFSPTYGWVLILRGMVGAGIAGAAQAFVLTSEYIPLKWRARLLVGSNIFWTFGSLFEIGIAALIVPNIPPDSKISGWRVLVIASSLPVALVIFTLNYLPESARFLVAAGRDLEAKDILEDAAKQNKQPQLPGPLKPEPSVNRGNIRDLFHSGTMTVTTLGSWMLWFSAAFIYYGMILLSALLLEVQQRDCAKDPDLIAHLKAGGSAASSSAVCSCMPPSKETYVSMLISTIGEIASIGLNLITLDRMGRKRSMALYLFLQSLTFFLLIPCGMPIGFTTTLIFIIRGVSTAFFNAVYIYVAEIYPTKVRALALGTCSASARVGAIITPFIAQVLLEHNRAAALIVYGVLSFVSAIVSLALPLESKDRMLSG